MTPYQKHVDRWKDCTDCDLYERRKRVVITRGTVPCDVLFVGEAPGASEDVLGRPFVGPAGKLLDGIIEQALDGQHDYALTNLVCCIPKGKDGNKIGEPPKESIEACATRLREFVKLCDPELIVCVGTLAGKWFSKLVDFKLERRRISIIHPAAILRMDVSQRGLAIQRCVVALKDAVEDDIPF